LPPSLAHPSPKTKPGRLHRRVDTPFEGSRIVRGGLYGISIDFGLEVVEKQSVCGTTFESKFTELTKKLKLTIASS
jgi:hypothetical protein